MARIDIDADRLHRIAEGQAVPHDGEQWVVALTRRLRRAPVAGPTPEAVMRLTARIDALIEGPAQRTPAAWFRANVLDHPRLQRAAAGLVLLVTATGGGAAAAGHNPIDVAAGTVRFAVDAVVSLDPRGKTPGDSTPPNPTPPSMTTAEATLTPAATPTPEPPTLAPGVTTTPEPAPGGVERTYPVLDIGAVTVAIEGDWLRIVDVETAPGWTAVLDTELDDSVEAVFRSAEEEVRFEAHLEGGEIRTSVEREGRARR
ncbi:MAG: hypothetical protein Kow0010_02390 [Dehalococcoidia bacterium]